MPTRLLYVPTNRRCTDQIADLATEALLLDGHLALIEHGAAPWSNEHAEALARERAGRGVVALHMTAAAGSAFLTHLVAGLGLRDSDADRLLALLDPTDVAYGAGPNKAALLAAALGAHALHRRDSDVRVDEWPSGPAYPCVPEMDALGATIGHETVAFVGTSTFGSPPHDRRDLLAAGEDFVVDIELLAAPDDPRDVLLDDMRQYLLVDPTIRYTEDFWELDTVGRTTMGACAMDGVFLELPEMPLRQTLGTDYMRRNVLRYLGKPIVFHSRKLRHDYDIGRATQADLSAVVEYAERDLRHTVLWPVLTRHHRAIGRSPADFVAADGSVDRDRYAANIRESLEQALPTMSGVPAAFAATYRAAADTVADGRVAARLRAVAGAVASGPDYAAEVANGVEDYCFLISHWSDLIRTAGQSSAALDPFYV